MQVGFVLHTSHTVHSDSTGSILGYVCIYIYIYSSYDETIQRKQSAQYRKSRAITVKVTLTYIYIYICMITEYLMLEYIILLALYAQISSTYIAHCPIRETIVLSQVLKK